MITMNFNETAIGMNVIAELKAKTLGITPADAERLTKLLFKGSVEFLSLVKRKEVQTVLEITDEKLNPTMFFIVDYIPNEGNDEMPGSWSVVVSTDKEDVDTDAQVYKCDAMNYLRILQASASRHWGMGFSEVTHALTMIQVLSRCLKDWADKNTRDDEEVELDMPGFFKLITKLEDGEKVMAYELDAALMQEIKDDAAIQK